jgi:hypothetical protein
LWSTVFISPTYHYAQHPHYLIILL